jgi:hypothetical protein
MSQEWYYAKGEHKKGPITSDQFRNLAKSGALKPTDLVWTEGMADWGKARTVRGIFPDVEQAGRSTPPPIPMRTPAPPLSTEQRITDQERPRWYYSISGSQAGPIVEKQLLKMFATGQLDSDTMVWTQELEKWVTASSIEVLVPSGNVKPSPPPMSHPEIWEPQYVGFWIRVGAYFIDTAVMIIPVCLASFLYRASTPASNEIEQSAVNFADSCIILIMWWSYYAVLESSAWQGTIGKRLLGL